MLNYEDLANLVLSYGSFSNKKLQKLCYYVYSWYLTLYGEKIANVSFEAWIHGPVSPEIYNIYRNYGWGEIPQYNGCLPINEVIYSRVTNIINEYINFNANELEEKTHNEIPWKSARNGYRKYESSNETIDDNTIINYYLNDNLYNKLSII